MRLTGRLSALLTMETMELEVHQRDARGVPATYASDTMEAIRSVVRDR